MNGAIVVLLATFVALPDSCMSTVAVSSCSGSGFPADATVPTNQTELGEKLMEMMPLRLVMSEGRATEDGYYECLELDLDFTSNTYFLKFHYQWTEYNHSHSMSWDTTYSNKIILSSPSNHMMGHIPGHDLWLYVVHLTEDVVIIRTCYHTLFSLRASTYTFVANGVDIDMVDRECLKNEVDSMFTLSTGGGIPVVRGVCSSLSFLE